MTSAPIDAEAIAVTREDRFYIDCEFDGHGGSLLSIAMVPDEGPSIHIRTMETARDPWVRANVVPLMDMQDAETQAIVPLNLVGHEIRSFLGQVERPVIVCDSPQDVRYFSAAITTADGGGYAPFPFEGMTFEVHGIDPYPTTLPGAVQHNAWWDALALREKLRTLSRPVSP